MLGNEHTKAFFLDLETARTEGPARSPRPPATWIQTLMEDLPVRVQQRSGIIQDPRARCRVLILDKPTAVLHSAGNR